MSTRTLFIGMDGATFKILDDLTNTTEDKQPVMPFLSSIYEEGVRSKLLSTPNPLTPPAWVSLMTGRSPGNHGIFDFIRAEERGNDIFFTLYDSRDSKAETIWSIASRQGKRIAALNFPFTAPPQKDLNGFMVPGFIPWRHLRRNTTPSDFYDRLKVLPEFNPKELAWWHGISKKKSKLSVIYLIKIVRTGSAIICHAIDSGSGLRNIYLSKKLLI
jgi:predicted AlkP superfamily phosphohydrolase/phosphomutase